MRRWPRRWWLVAAVARWVRAARRCSARCCSTRCSTTSSRWPTGDATDVLELAEAPGCGSARCCVVDASRRTTAANAYVQGSGPPSGWSCSTRCWSATPRTEVASSSPTSSPTWAAATCARDRASAAVLAPSRSGRGASAVRSPARADGAAALPALALAAGLARPRGADRRPAQPPHRAPGGRAIARAHRRRRRRSSPSSGASRCRTWPTSIRRGWVHGLLASHPPTAERIGHALRVRRRTGASSLLLPPAPGPRRTPAGS